MGSKTTKAKPSLFERLKGGLEESIEYADGNTNLRTTVVPDAPPDVSGTDVVAIRERMAVSQAVFAKVLNVSTKTVQSWEQGVRRPSQSALRLLQIVGSDPSVVLRIATSSHPNRTRRTTSERAKASRKHRRARKDELA
jgi:putative transcriptional regulator